MLSQDGGYADLNGDGFTIGATIKYAITELRYLSDALCLWHRTRV
jgi:hypothetical protein